MNVNNYDLLAQNLANWLKNNYPEFWKELKDLELEGENRILEESEDLSFVESYGNAQTEITRLLLPIFKAKGVTEVVLMRSAIRKIYRAELNLTI